MLSKRTNASKKAQKANNTKPQKLTHNEQVWRSVMIISIVFLGMLFLIGMLMGFHPPQPDSPILQRITSARHTHTEYSKHQHHDFHHSNSHKDGPTIFVAMPSLNDPDCNASIASAFENAANPNRIFFGVHQQTNLDKYHDCLDISGLDCPSHPLCSRLYQIRISRVTDQQAFGPTWGRYMADKLFKDEDFYLITDSHTFFRPKWDDLMVGMWASTNNEYAVLTHYPKGSDQMESNLQSWERTPKTMKTYGLCGTVWEASVNHLPRNANGCYFKANDLSHPILVPFWGAGLAFCKSHFRDVVPFDPHVKWLFHGEEFHIGTRLWTFGYDFYSPQFDLLWHKYADKAKRGRMPYSKEIGDLRDASEKRVNYLWDLLETRTPGESDKANLEDIEKYPLGNKRTIEQFWKFVGCDPIEQNITIFPNKLWSNGGLQRVPWNNIKEDPILSNSVNKL